jgi:hypothetical protein
VRMLVAFLGYLLLGLGPGAVLFLSIPARRPFLVILTFARCVLLLPPPKSRLARSWSNASAHVPSGLARCERCQAGGPVPGPCQTLARFRIPSLNGNVRCGGGLWMWSSPRLSRLLFSQRMHMAALVAVRRHAHSRCACSPPPESFARVSTVHNRDARASISLLHASTLQPVQLQPLRVNAERREGGWGVSIHRVSWCSAAGGAPRASSDVFL